uniref:Uncharacterized protein n=1 Tax=Brassica oleracea TaxID=3712 RepID=A0A3P6EVP8_BRAOL|nr:unnamed protein product [Brassica oleracea]
MCLNFMIMATGQVIVEEMNPKSDDQYKVWKTLNHPHKIKSCCIKSPVQFILPICCSRWKHGYNL